MGCLQLSLCCNYWGIYVTKTHSVWVMKENGIAESWTKLFDICIHKNLVNMFGFTKNGEVLVVDSDGNLSSYEPNSQRALDLHIGGIQQLFSLDSYVESLVPLNVAD